MVKVIEESHEKSEGRKRYESLVNFLRKEIRQAKPRLEMTITDFIEDYLLQVTMFATSKHKVERALQINFFSNCETGYSGIREIELSKPEYFNFTYELADKYEKQLGKGEEVTIFK